MELMTRRCMDCKRVMGEKCPACGSENVFGITELRGEGAEQRRVEVFTCMNKLCPKLDGMIRFRFDEGTGPKGESQAFTDGICCLCLMQRNAEMRRA